MGYASGYGYYVAVAFLSALLLCSNVDPLFKPSLRALSRYVTFYLSSRYYHILLRWETNLPKRGTFK